MIKNIAISIILVALVYIIGAIKYRNPYPTDQYNLLVGKSLLIDEIEIVKTVQLEGRYLDKGAIRISQTELEKYPIRDSSMYYSMIITGFNNNYHSIKIDSIVVYNSDNKMFTMNYYNNILTGKDKYRIDLNIKNRRIYRNRMEFQKYRFIDDSLEELRFINRVFNAKMYTSVGDRLLIPQNYRTVRD